MSDTMPTTLLTLPRELRDQINTYLIFASDFTFLQACRQLNEEGTPLLYKHHVYHIRALTRRNEKLAAPTMLPPMSLIQNLYISMPPFPSRKMKGPNYEISWQTSTLLSQFSGTEIRRRLCHLDLQKWPFSAELARRLCGFGGFEILRVEVTHLNPSTLYHDPEWPDKHKKDRMEFIQDTIGKAFGKVDWVDQDLDEEWNKTSVAEFRPRRST